MHLRLEDFETYLSTDDITPETLAVIEPIQAHLDGCEQCRSTLSHLSIVYHTTAEETLGASVSLLNQEKTVRRGLVFTVLYKALYDALPREQDTYRKLISDFANKRYGTYHIHKPQKRLQEPKIPNTLRNIEEPAEPPKSNILDFAALKNKPKEETQSVASHGLLNRAATTLGPRHCDFCCYDYDGKNLTVTASLRSPVTHMLLQPENGLELPQLRPAILDANNCYIAVFPLENPGDDYQIYIFTKDS